MPIIQIFSKIWEVFWSMWPKNFLFLVVMSALCEAISVSIFKISGNRGSLSILAYILGFFVVAFYAEATKYAKIAASYPVYLAALSIFISLASFVVLREKVAPQWFIGFVLVIIGVSIIYSSLPAK